MKLLQPKAAAKAAAIVAVATAGVIIALYFALHRQMATADQAEARMMTHFETRQALQSVLQGHLDLETGMRGYLITGDERFLEPYTASLASIQPRIARLSELAADSEISPQDLQAIEQASAVRLSTASAALAFTKEGNFPEARALVNKGEGWVAMDRLRERIQILDENEVEHARQQHQTTLEMHASRDQWLHAILGLLGFGFFAAALAAYQAITVRESTIQEAGQIYNAMIDPVIVMDRQGVIVEVNEATTRKFRYARHELVGSHIGVLLADWPSPEAIYGRIQTLVTAGKAGAIRDYTLRRRDGTLFRGYAAMSTTSSGANLRVIAVVRPLTPGELSPATKSELFAEPEDDRGGLVARMQRLQEAVAERAGPVQPSMVALTHRSKP